MAEGKAVELKGHEEWVYFDSKLYQKGKGTGVASLKFS
jgi:hypothetical protein